AVLRGYVLSGLSALGWGFGPTPSKHYPFGLKGPRHDDNGSKHRGRAKPQVMASPIHDEAEEARREIVTDEYETSRKAASQARICNRLSPRSRRSSIRAPFR